MTAEEMYIDMFGEESKDDHTSYNMISFAEAYHEARKEYEINKLVEQLKRK